MSEYEHAVTSILRGAEARGDERFADVARIDVDGETATLAIELKSGETRSAMIGMHAALIPPPGQRPRAPADVHDAVKAALLQAIVP